MRALKSMTATMLLIGGGQAFADEDNRGPVVRDHRTEPEPNPSLDDVLSEFLDRQSDAIVRQHGGLHAPSDLEAYEVTSTHLRLSWTDNSTNEFGVRLYRGRGVMGCSGDPVEELGGEPITWEFLRILAPPAAMVDTGLRRGADDHLSPQTDYCYRMYAYNGEETSGSSNSVCIQTLSRNGASSVTAEPVCGANHPPAGPLAAPSNLAISDLTSTRLTLSWHDNSTTELGVSVERVDPVESRRVADQPGDEIVTWEVVANFDEPDIANRPGTGMRSRADFDLTPKTNYCYRMRAFKGDQMSEYSDTVCIVTP